MITGSRQSVERRCALSVNILRVREFATLDVSIRLVVQCTGLEFLVSESMDKTYYTLAAVLCTTAT